MGPVDLVVVSGGGDPRDARRREKPLAADVDCGYLPGQFSMGSCSTLCPLRSVLRSGFCPSWALAGPKSDLSLAIPICSSGCRTGGRCSGAVLRTADLLTTSRIDVRQCAIRSPISQARAVVIASLPPGGLHAKKRSDGRAASRAERRSAYDGRHLLRGGSHPGGVASGTTFYQVP